MGEIRFVHVGHANMVNANRVMAILHGNTACVEKYVTAAKRTNTYIDATHSRKRRCILLLDDGRVVGSVLNAKTLVARFNNPALDDAFDDVDETESRKRVSLEIPDDDEDMEEDDEVEVEV